MAWSEPEIRASHAAILELAVVLGEYRDNFAVVGGWVPPLLFREAAALHVGSWDVDLVLDHERLREDAYKQIEELLLSRGYYRKDLAKYPFSFFRQVPVDGTDYEVQLDLLAGEYGGTGPGRRTQVVQEDLRARKARGADMVFDQGTLPPLVDLEGRRPDGSLDQAQIRVAGMVPFLVMKAAAMRDRDKPKDAYDIVFCLKQYPGGVDALAEHIRPHLRHGLVQEAVVTLKEKFQSPQHRGAVHAATFSIPGDAAAVEARVAYVLMQALLGKLGV